MGRNRVHARNEAHGRRIFPVGKKSLASMASPPDPVLRLQLLRASSPTLCISRRPEEHHLLHPRAHQRPQDEASLRRSPPAWGWRRSGGVVLERCWPPASAPASTSSESKLAVSRLRIGASCRRIEHQPRRIRDLRRRIQNLRRGGKGSFMGGTDQPTCGELNGCAQFTVGPCCSQ
jgi:hypothetical protein